MPQQSSNISLPESKIYARRHSRGHLRHLVPPEALGLAGHDKPVPILRLTVNVCFVRLCRSRNRRAAPSGRLGIVGHPSTPSR